MGEVVDSYRSGTFKVLLKLAVNGRPEYVGRLAFLTLHRYILWVDFK